MSMQYPIVRIALVFIACLLAPTLLTSCAAKHDTAGGDTGVMIKPEAAPAGMARADDSDPELINAKSTGPKYFARV